MAVFAETLDVFNILRNIIYSGLLLINSLIGFIGLLTYQWIETTADEMEESGIVIPPNLPGLNRVSCGLMTFCLDAAGRVAECSLPWPTYGGNYTSIPIFLWRLAFGFIMTGLCLQLICFLYTLLACFGCYSSKIQSWSTKISTFGGVLMLAGILCWAAGFEDVAVKDCFGGVPKDADGTCQAWQPVFPSERVEADGEIGCRICPHVMKGFMPASTCRVGWGAILVVVSCILALFSGCVGEEVKSREKKREDQPKQRSLETAVI